MLGLELFIEGAMERWPCRHTSPICRCCACYMSGNTLACARPPWSMRRRPSNFKRRRLLCSVSTRRILELFMESANIASTSCRLWLISHNWWWRTYDFYEESAQLRAVCLLHESARWITFIGDPDRTTHHLTHAGMLLTQ